MMDSFGRSMSILLIFFEIDNLILADTSLVVYFLRIVIYKAGNWSVDVKQLFQILSIFSFVWER